MLVSPSSIKRNIVANYAVQIYVMGIGVTMAPVYLSYMGTEAYGLVGFFTMMASLFTLLDVGLTPTLVRETARFRGGAINASTLRAFLRVLEVVFGFISVAGAVSIVLLAHPIATQWLKVKQLPIAQVTEAVMLMGLAVPLRWVAGLYRGVVNGFEHQVWLSGYSFIITTLRFVGVLCVFVTLGVTPVLFFAYQFLVALAELVGLTVMTYRLMPGGGLRREKLSWQPLLANLRFSLIIAVTASVWVLAQQSDKLILSKILTLKNFGVFSIALAAAATVYAIGAPFGQALLPRLTRLVAENNEEGTTTLYGHATQLVCVLLTPTVGALCFFAEPILWAWTGKALVAHQAAPILRLYAIGNGWAILCMFPYYLQYAKGDLRLHFIGSIALAALIVPGALLGARYYGAIGTGVVWATLNGLYALCWTPVIHARVFKGQHQNWLLKNIAPIAIPTLFVAWVASIVVHWPSGRWPTIAVAGAIGLLLLAIAASGSSIIRQRSARILAPRINRISKRWT